MDAQSAPSWVPIVRHIPASASYRGGRCIAATRSRAAPKSSLLRLLPEGSARDQYGAGGVVRHVIRYAAQEHLLEVSHPPASKHYQIRLMLFGVANNDLARIPSPLHIRTVDP